MALKETPLITEHWQAPDFEDLPGVDGKSYGLADVQGENGTLIMFICNHCPYVKAITDRLARDMAELQAAGIGVAAIMSNDTDNYPEDSFDNMAAFAAEHGFTFPYLWDETQGVARAYGAVCTPDFFGFNAVGQLVYRGRLDSAGAQPAGPDTQRELVSAMLEAAATGQAPAEQTPSMGCSIKWKSGA